MSGFRPLLLHLGDHGPRQQSRVSCGAACLLVARMLHDAAFAAWITHGMPLAPGDPWAPVMGSDLTPGEPPGEACQTGDDTATAHEPDHAAYRFELTERRAQRVANSAVAPGPRYRLPWPRLWGTSPWGALGEMERHGSLPGVAYRLTVVRYRADVAAAQAYDDVVRRVQVGAPALLYVGNASLPRHCVLIFRAPGEEDLPLVYEPATGHVGSLRRDAWHRRQLGLGGWDVPWLVIEPIAVPVAGSETVERHRHAPAPRPLAEGS